MVPEPRRGHAVTINQGNVWLFGGRTGYNRDFDDLFELSMHSLTWTLIQTNLIRPEGRDLCTLSMISDGKLLLHCGRDSTFFLYLVFYYTSTGHTISKHIYTIFTVT